MTTNPEVDAYLEDLDHPLKDVMRAVRAAILEADGRISEALIAALTEAYATMDTTKGENGA